MEFSRLDAELADRRIAAAYALTTANGRLYRIARHDVSRLPWDDNGPYLGDDDSGHSVYPLSDTVVAWFCGPAPAWHEIFLYDEPELDSGS